MTGLFIETARFGDYKVLKPSINIIAGRFFGYVIRQRANNAPEPVCGSTLNTHKFNQGERSSGFKMILQNMDNLRADGMPVVWFSRFFGDKIEGRSSTTDFIHKISELSTPVTQLKYFFLGGEEGVSNEAAKIIEEMYDVKVTGIRSGFNLQKNNEDIISRINSLRPDILWVGMGVPKEQEWVAENKCKLRIPMILTCGGMFDFITGRNLRAPEWVQESGLEWLHRLCTDPLRLWKRYTWGNMKFLFYFYRSLLEK